MNESRRRETAYVSLQYLSCRPMHAYLGTKSIEHNGTYILEIYMHMSAPLAFL